MNWGKGIITGMIIFMLFILSMCLYMFRMPADEYDHQYYEKGLSFDKDYDREQQVSKDHARPMISQQGQALLLVFKVPATGQIKLIRPSSQALDKVFPISSDAAGRACIDLKTVKAGRWQLILEWQSDHKSYLFHQEIDIQ